MRKKLIYLGIVILYLGSILLIYWFKNDNEILVFNNNEYRIKEIDDQDKYKIKIYYPISDYKNLDNVIKSFIYDNVREFKDMVKEIDIQENMYYDLNINYDEYHYRDYLSYVFYVEMYTGGAHPEHFIKTFNYDTDGKKMITINDLIKIDNNLLNKLTKISREKLLASGKFNGNGYVLEMFNDGTSPKINNYQNFVLTDGGLKIFFDYYQIAPYYMGMSEIIIPYNELNLDI